MSWIEVKVRYEKMTESGKSVKVTDPYLVDALSCTEAEARVVDEVSKSTSDFNVLAVNKTKISEIFRDDSGDKWYKVKVNFISLDEKNAAEKKTASYILVQASDFDSALRNFHDGMKGTMADYEVEAISETKIVDVLAYNAASMPLPVPTKGQLARALSADKEVRRAVEDFKDAVPDGCRVSVQAEGCPETAVVIDKTHKT